VFKPAGVAARNLQQVTMTLDEFEAVRLADLEQLYQEQAAARMGVSRPTFGRILTSAHRKIADALVGGKVLRIEGGQVACAATGRPRCQACQLEWDGPRADPCPRCQCPNRAERLASATTDAGDDGACSHVADPHRKETAT
jgi:predicted DNA-binding protein (UPF0251 family)